MWQSIVSWIRNISTKVRGVDTTPYYWLLLITLSVILLLETVFRIQQNHDVVEQIFKEPEALASLIGTIVAGLTAVGAIMLSQYITSVEHNRQNKADRKAYLTSIKTELTLVFETYKEMIGDELKSLADSEPVNGYFQASQEYFEMFSDNTHMLGKIESEPLRLSILETYFLLKATFDALLLNNHYNDLVEERRSNGGPIGSALQGMYHQQIMHRLKSTQAASRASLKTRNDKIYIKIPETILLIDQSLASGAF